MPAPADSADIRVRRPRMSAERRQELLVAAVGLLCEVGYEALTMDALATKAHCSKATLYRMWPGKPQLVAAAIRAIKPVDMTGIDTGTLRGDLVAVAHRISPAATNGTALFAAVNHAVLLDSELAEVLRTTLMEPDSALIVEIVERAVQRGELERRPAAADHLPRIIFGAVIARAHFDGTYADPDYLVHIIDDVLIPALRNS